MNTTQAFTAGIAVGATGAFTLSVLIWQIPKAVRRFLDWRAARWTDADELEIRAFEQFVDGYNTDTGEIAPVSPAVMTEWVRPDEEPGSIIPQWRPHNVSVLALPPYKGPSIVRVRDWVNWNYGDLLYKWSMSGNQQNGGRHRLVR
jgi:hypothetical protein